MIADAQPLGESEGGAEPFGRLSTSSYASTGMMVGAGIERFPFIVFAGKFTFLSHIKAIHAHHEK